MYSMLKMRYTCTCTYTVWCVKHVHVQYLTKITCMYMYMCIACHKLDQFAKYCVIVEGTQWVVMPTRFFIFYNTYENKFSHDNN